MALKTIDDTVLSSIADSIRGKNKKTTTYKPTEMAAAIDAIEGGGGLMQMDSSGTSGYICGYPGTYLNSWLGANFAYWFKPDWGPIDGCQGLCYGMDISPIDTITFAEVDNSTTLAYTQAISLFRDAYGKTQPPILIGPCSPGTYMFSTPSFESIPTEVTEQLTSSGGSKSWNYAMTGCYILQDISGIKALAQRDGFNKVTPPLYMYSNCYLLKECFVPAISTVSSTSQARLTNIFGGCRSLENIEWGSDYLENTSYAVTLDLSTNSTGYWATAPSSSFQTNYGIGLPEKQITDLDSYNALKDDPYAWTLDSAFSHLNHTNAVKILNNLPTLSSEGGTILFAGTEGSGYDDPISDLTDEEIAVATNKKWTVSIS